MERLIENLQDTFKDINVKKILDVGTGRGSFIKVLEHCFNKESEIIGIDTSNKMLDIAKEHFKDEKIKFSNMDVTNMDFQDNTFDVICISNTLHHLPNLNKALKEIKRVLKSDGYFVINEMFCDNQSQKQLSHVYLHHLGAEIDTTLGNFHNKTYERQEILNIVKDLDLDIVKSFNYNSHEEQIKEQNEEEEKKTLDSFFNAIENRIGNIKDLSQQMKYKGKLEKLRKELYNNGIFAATELAVISKNK